MQLELDGEPYELPLVSSFDLDEDRIFYKATGLHAEDVWLGLQDEGDLSFAALLRNEGFLPAMAHIAYRREHPNDTEAVIVEMVGRQNRFSLIRSIAESIEGDDAPGESEGATSAPDESSKRSDGTKPSSKRRKDGSSGKRSEKSSARPADTPGATGTDGSDGPFTSGQSRQAA